MAHYQSEYGRDQTTDEFGNPIRRTEVPVHHGTTGYGRDQTTVDEFGNPIRRSDDPVHHGITGATTGYGPHDTGTGYGTHGTTGTGYGTHDTTGTGYGTHGTTGTGYGTHGTATGPTGFAATTAGGHGVPLHRSDSSSSVSRSKSSLHANRSVYFCC